MEKRLPIRNNHGFFGLLGILLALVIIAIFFSLWAPHLGKNSPSSLTAIENTVKTVAPETAIDTTGYSSVLKSTVKQIKAIEQQQLERGDQILQETQDLANPLRKSN